MDKKKVILSLLSESDGYISGEEVARRLSLSRMSVSNSVKALSSEGYCIESKTGVGYRYSPSLSYTREMVEEAISPLFPVYFHNELSGSSNTVAKKLVLDGVKPPFVVVARTQSGGKGRMGRFFSSPAGGLYFSLALPEDMIFSSPDHITTSTSLAVARVLDRECGIESRIKWVNDIYIGGKKAVGILSEGIVNLEMGGLESVVIGVGVNLNTPLSSFPPELRDQVTSYMIESGRAFPYVPILKMILSEIVGIQNKSYLDEYRRKCFILSQDVRVLSYGKDLGMAKCISIDDDAHLVVMFPDGSIRHLSSGEVSLKI